MTAQEAIQQIIEQFMLNTVDPKKGSFNSTHEGSGVILEEWDEFKSAVHDNDKQKASNEAKDIAVACIQFMVDFGNAKEERTCIGCDYENNCFGMTSKGCRRYPSVEAILTEGDVELK